jgi:hypothetical protein
MSVAEEEPLHRYYTYVGRRRVASTLYLNGMKDPAVHNGAVHII